MSASALATRLQTREALAFNSRRLLKPAIFLLWLLPFITISEPEDWIASRFGTISVLPPELIKLMKFVGRGGAIGLMLFSLLSIWRHKKRDATMRLMLPFLLFTAYGILSTLWSPLPTVTLTQSLTLALSILLAFYIAITWEDDKDTERLVQHAALAILVLSVLLIALHFGIPRSGALTKASSGVLHSTNAGAAGGLCIVLTMAARLLWKSPWAVWWLPIVAIEAAMMIIAGNRLSLAITAMTVAVLLAVALDRGIAALLVLVISVGCILYLAADPHLAPGEEVADSLGLAVKQGQSSQQIGSLSGRDEMWAKIWDSYLESPLLGHGYFVTSSTGRIYVWYEWGNWTAHNALLQLLATSGAFGAVLLFAGFGCIVFKLASGSRDRANVRNSLILVAIATIWYLGWSILNESFLGPLQPETVVFSVMLGVAAGVAATTNAPRIAKQRASSRSSDAAR